MIQGAMEAAMQYDANFIYLNHLADDSWDLYFSSEDVLASRSLKIQDKLEVMVSQFDIDGLLLSAGPNTLLMAESIFLRRDLIISLSSA
jgi:hypothetical protein